MLYELNPDDAWLAVCEIGDFDLGAMEAWEWWFKHAWRGLEASGWFDELCVRDSPVFGIQQRITLFALRWIAEDFLNVLDGLTDPEWDHWMTLLNLDGAKLMHVVRGHPKWPAIEEEIREELGDEETSDDPAEAQRLRNAYEEELDIRLLPQAACFAAAHQRQRLLPWLRRIFLKTEHLFQSLWAVTHCGSAGSWGDALSENDETFSSTDIGWPFEHESDPDLSPKLAAKLNRIAMAAFTDGLGFDSDTAERLNAWEWVESGCRIRNQGYPQYMGPWMD